MGQNIICDTTERTDIRIMTDVIIPFVIVITKPTSNTFNRIIDNFLF